MTINEFGNEIIELTHSKSKIIYKPLPIDDPMRRRPDITLAKKILDWEPQISRKEGLARTLEDFKERLGL